jgi:hypothetical protein
MRAVLGIMALGATVVAAPVKLIFETDMSGDCDDAGALAVIHALADKGECELVAVMTNDRNGAAPIAANVINTYYGRPDVPIGMLAETSDGHGSYPKNLAAEFKHSYDPAKTIESTVLYRKLLANAKDNSIVIVSVGFLPNLGRLLKTGKDQNSPLNGSDLVRAKVKILVAMAGKFPDGREYNIYKYGTEDGAYALHNWPTPVVYSGWEIGAPIQTGSRLYKETGKDNPVRRAYELYMRWNDERQKSRSSWDQTAVLYAVRGLGERWTLSDPGAIRVHLDKEGSNTWVSDPGRDTQIAQRYLVKKADNSVLAKEIEDLMVTPPAK